MAPDVILQIPRQSLWSIWEVIYEYDLPTLPTLCKPRILDIGANTGIFSIMCSHFMPGCRIMCFEPHPETAKHLRNNVQGLAVEVHEMAVIGHERPLTLHEGKDSRLSCSLYDMGDQDMETAIPVTGLLAAELPPCELMKIDTEGAEVEILENYRHLDKVNVLLCEVHGNEQEKEISRIAECAFKAGLRFHDQRKSTARFVRSRG